MKTVLLMFIATFNLVICLQANFDRQGVFVIFKSYKCINENCKQELEAFHNTLKNDEKPSFDVCNKCFKSPKSIEETTDKDAEDFNKCLNDNSCSNLNSENSVEWDRKEECIQEHCVPFTI